MNKLMKNRNKFRPSLCDSCLEDRTVMSTGGAIPATPAPAAPPVGRSFLHLQAAELKSMYRTQIKAATATLRTAVQADLNQLYANGTPTAQQISNFNSNVAGAADATALRLASQASLLPGGSTRLVPAIENALVGSSSQSLVNRLSTLTNSSQINATVQSLQKAMTKQINSVSNQAISQASRYISTTPLTRLSVSSSGTTIPVEQYMGSQVVSQLANNLGSLAANYSTLASALATSNTGTGAVNLSQALQSEFGSQAQLQLSTSAYQLASDLALFNGSSNVLSQLAPAFFGSSSTSLNGLISQLENIPVGSGSVNSMVESIFQNSFATLASPVSGFFRMAQSSSFAMPTTGMTSPFASLLSGSNFTASAGSSSTTPTTAPVTGFGAGFDNLVTAVNQTLLGTTGTANDGTTYQSR